MFIVLRVPDSYDDTGTSVIGLYAEQDKATEAAEIALAQMKASPFANDDKCIEVRFVEPEGAVDVHSCDETNYLVIHTTGYIAQSRDVLIKQYQEWPELISEWWRGHPINEVGPFFGGQDRPSDKV